jgi:cold-inducible RNA-binding protein
MGKRLFVGNIPYQTDEGQLRSFFEQDGRQVAEVKIVADRETGRPRGFAFVEMATDDQARAAVTALNGKPFGGRPLTVSEARERAPGMRFER